MSNEQTRKISFSPPDITDKEIEEVVKVLKSGWITTGLKTKEFERRIAGYTGAKKAVCLNSATAALELTLRILGIGPGDEVITTVYTYSASAAAINHVGAKIVLIDVAPDSFEMDYSRLADAVTEKTKAVIPVDIAGKMCDYEAVYKVVEDKKVLFIPQNDIQKLFNRVIVITDAAHSFGAVRGGIKSGLAADFTSFSFHAVKNLTTAEGGAVVWRDIDTIYNENKVGNEWLYNQYMLYCLHGQTKDALAKSCNSAWEYDIAYLGYKYNMTDISSALGIAQLDRYGCLLNRRKEIIEMYDKKLIPNGVKVLKHFDDFSASSGHLYLTRILGADEIKRNAIIYKMAEYGIPCNVHYKPLAMFSAYKNLGFDIKDYPNSFSQYQNEITLPLHTLLSDDDVDYITNCFIRTIDNICPMV